MNNEIPAKIRQAFLQTLTIFKTVLPMLVGVLLLVSLFNQLLQHNYRQWFSGNYLLDPLIGALSGSISFGMPITSYIAGGELLKSGVGILAVTAFIMSWTTVGLAMIPVEAAALGRRFAIIRNLINFIFAILVSIVTVATLRLLS